MTESELLPCPFCGNDKPYFERRGTGRQSCIVECGNCGCRHESSDEGDRSGVQWNERASSPPVPQQLAKLKSALYDISSGDFDATDDEVRALMCVIQELHLVPQQGAEAIKRWAHYGDDFDLHESDDGQWVRYEDHLATSPQPQPVPQQGAKAVDPWRCERCKKTWYTSDICACGAMRPEASPLEARSRDIKLNQEIDAEDAVLERAAKLCELEAAASSIGHGQKARWQAEVAGRCAKAIRAARKSQGEAS